MYKRLEVVIAAFLYYSGLVALARWWKSRSGPSLVILNYHCATGGDLRKHLLHFRRHYRVLHLEPALEELYAQRKNASPKQDQRPALVLTFDDGYYDNYTHAFKFACELQVPITIFLIPGYIESGKRFWWFEPDHLVSQTRTETVVNESRSYNLSHLEERKALIQAIDKQLRFAPSVAEREAFLVSMTKSLDAFPEANPAERPYLPISWAEAQEMEESGWISFGAHTMHHPILAYLKDPTEVEYEVKTCRTVLEQKLGHPVRAFAYPVGGAEHIGERSVRAVQAAEFDWALTTIYGFNTWQSDPHMLHRLDVDVDQHWLVVAGKTSGAWNFLASICRAPIRHIYTLLHVRTT